MAALIRLVVHSWPTLARAGGCSLFWPLGVIQETLGSRPARAFL
jgi:hypothetical protein